MDLLDVSPIVERLNNGIFLDSADVNCDGAVNLLDVERFVGLLSN